MSTPLLVGDPVIWIHYPRGGYCHPVRVLAVFKGWTLSGRARIEVFRLNRGPGPRAGCWERLRRSVKATGLCEPTQRELEAIRDFSARCDRDEELTSPLK